MKRPPRMSKTKSERAHARRRLMERYGLQYTKVMRRELERRVKHGGLIKKVMDQSLRLSVYMAPWATTDGAVLDGDVLLLFVWDRTRQEIVTFLPRTWTPADHHKPPATPPSTRHWQGEPP